LRIISTDQALICLPQYLLLRLSKLSAYITHSHIALSNKCKNQIMQQVFILLILTIEHRSHFKWTAVYFNFDQTISFLLNWM